MSTIEQAVPTDKATTWAPQMPVLSTFVAVILGASLIEFNKLLYPPQIASLNFWALIVAYYGALTTWYAISSLMRTRLFTDTLTSRIWFTGGLLMLASYLGLMYFAARISDSVFAYMWCWVVIFFLYWFTILIRHLELRMPEPLTICTIHGTFAILAAVAYSIWVRVFPPVPDIANWAFVFLAFVIIFSYRLVQRWRRVYRPEEKQ